MYKWCCKTHHKHTSHVKGMKEASEEGRLKRGGQAQSSYTAPRLGSSHHHFRDRLVRLVDCTFRVVVDSGTVTTCRVYAAARWSQVVG